MQFVNGMTLGVFMMCMLFSASVPTAVMAQSDPGGGVPTCCCGGRPPHHPRSCGRYRRSVWTPPPPPTPAEIAAEFKREGQRYLNSREWRKAHEAFRSALAETEEDPELKLKLDEAITGMVSVGVHGLLETITKESPGYEKEALRQLADYVNRLPVLEKRKAVELSKDVLEAGGRVESISKQTSSDLEKHAFSILKQVRLPRDEKISVESEQVRAECFQELMRRFSATPEDSYFYASLAWDSGIIEKWVKDQPVIAYGFDPPSPSQPSQVLVRLNAGHRASERNVNGVAEGLDLPAIQKEGRQALSQDIEDVLARVSKSSSPDEKPEKGGSKEDLNRAQSSYRRQLEAYLKNVGNAQGHSSD